ncbi:VP2 [black sea bass-associated polyomavirus 1]|uniref:VP2 n=1 Tax=black sea bass-associated polyomavirus 1 TaxID=2849508 RepID=A0A0A1C950_9POLY|nr:VP2 [Black sea bass polyomavirus 1]AIX88119.1 VP2 [Black sea bass polyomavirus 1]
MGIVIGILAAIAADVAADVAAAAAAAAAAVESVTTVTEVGADAGVAAASAAEIGEGGADVAGFGEAAGGDAADGAEAARPLGVKPLGADDWPDDSNWESSTDSPNFWGSFHNPGEDPEPDDPIDGGTANSRRSWSWARDNKGNMAHVGGLVAGSAIIGGAVAVSAATGDVAGTQLDAHQSLQVTAMAFGSSTGTVVPEWLESFMEMSDYVDAVQHLQQQQIDGELGRDYTVSQAAAIAEKTTEMRDDHIDRREDSYHYHEQDYPLFDLVKHTKRSSFWLPGADGAKIITKEEMREYERELKERYNRLTPDEKKDIERSLDKMVIEHKAKEKKRRDEEEKKREKELVDKLKDRDEGFRPKKVSLKDIEQDLEPELRETMMQKTRRAAKEAVGEIVKDGLDKIVPNTWASHYIRQKAEATLRHWAEEKVDNLLRGAKDQMDLIYKWVIPDERDYVHQDAFSVKYDRENPKVMYKRGRQWHLRELQAISVSYPATRVGWGHMHYYEPVRRRIQVAPGFEQGFHFSRPTKAQRRHLSEYLRYKQAGFTVLPPLNIPQQLTVAALTLQEARASAAEVGERRRKNAKSKRGVRGSEPRSGTKRRR